MNTPFARIRFIALRMALAYGAFGAAWIVGSDHLAVLLFPDPADFARVQSWKGLVFVGLSALLIFLLAGFFIRALALSEWRYRGLFADSPEALAIYRLDDLVVLNANAAAGRLLGWDPAAMTGRPVTDFMSEAAAETLRRELDRLRQVAQPPTVWRLRHADGRLLDVSVHGQTYRENGRLLRQVLLMDITARVRAETELLRTLDDLAASNERLRELGHAISHDLQEPLRQVASFVQLLQRRYGDRLDDEAGQFIGYAVEGVSRLKALIADVERFAAPVSPDVRMVAVDEVVASVLADLRRAIDSARARVAVAKLPEVLADPRRLEVVFHTLIDNAIKYRRPDVACEISVRAEPANGDWVFRVQDNGIGIAPEFRSAVFSLFRRLHTRDRIPGNGSGLALARKMVESLGGHIWVEPAPDGGSVFAFTLAAPPRH